MSSCQPCADGPQAHAAKPRLGRREMLARVGILAGIVPVAGAVDGLFVTPQWLTATDHAVGTGPIGASAQQDRLSIVQISDLHLKRIGHLEERLLAAVHAAPPDVIVLTGDMIDRQPSLGRFADFLRELPPQPRRFAITGNWEHWAGVPLAALGRLYESHAVELLVNRSIVFDHRGCRVRMTGLDDLVGGRPDAAFALENEEPCANHLLLAHCPAVRDAVPLPAAHGPTFMLSGHTHGGQIAPLGIVLKLPHGSGGYVSGWYRDGGTPLYVSRGIGTSLVPMRIGAAPELPRFEWSLA